jgi:DNA-binding transcriptional LysR family regulator
LSFTLRQIRYFVAAASKGQFSQAAIELNISQSAITTSIKLLEEVLGTTLFIRGSNGVVLTPHGVTFLRHARDILASVEAGMQSQHRTEPSAGGKLSVGVTYSIAGYFVAPIIVRFKRIYPNVEVTIEEGSRASIEGSVRDGTFDIGVTLTQSDTSQDGVVVKPLYSWPRRLWLPSGHPLLSAETVGLEDVSELPYIALTLDNAWDYALRYWGLTRFRPNVIFKTGSIEALRTMVGAGMGVTILSDMLYRQWTLEGQRIEVRDLKTKIPPLDVGYVVRKNHEIATVARTFLAYLQRATNSSGVT